MALLIYPNRHDWQVVAEVAKQVAQGLTQVATHLKLLVKVQPVAQLLHPNEVQLIQFCEQLEHPPVELL